MLAAFGSLAGFDLAGFDLGSFSSKRFERFGGDVTGVRSLSASSSSLRRFCRLLAGELGA